MRKALLILLLCWSPWAWAGTVTLGWDYPLTAQEGAQYIVRLSTLTTPTPRLEEQLVQVLSKQACLQETMPDRTADSLCGTLCLNPGDYAMSLLATRGGQRSPESNVVDLDFTNTLPCTPATLPDQPPPAPPSNPGPAVVKTVVPLGAALIAIQAASPPKLPELPNMRCVSWAITGPCLCGFPPHPCVSVEYWEPGWLVETVKKPGTTSLDILGPLLDAALGVGTVPPFGGGGYVQAKGGGNTNLHYMEAHVFAFPQLLGGPCTGCAPGIQNFVLNYASEIDPLWRTATAVPSPLSVIEQIGVWAPLFPRVGFAIHSSEPVASMIAAARAINIAFNPVGTPPNVEARVVPLKTESLSPCCQLAWPKQTGCFPPGIPPVAFETGALSIRGTYISIWWRKRQCCVEAPGTCGITLPGVGLSGQSACVIPSTP